MIEILGIYPRDMQDYIHPKTCPWIFIVILFVIGKNWKKNLVVFQWLSGQTNCELYPGKGLFSQTDDDLLQIFKERAHNLSETWLKGQTAYKKEKVNILNLWKYC